ncbi:hypothetical protein KKG22_00670, partial [Patescibacteria group bacterium]|nr:hypothetical protein [Patescibacteria group bacterium]
MRNLGERFIHRIDKGLHDSKVVEHEQERKERRGGEQRSQPEDKIADWFKVLERTHGHADDPRVAERLKKYYKKEHVILAENVPERYFDLQKEIARNEGHGNIEIGEDQRREMIESLQEDQAASLDMWTDYFLSADSSSIPMWAKYWAYTGMLKLGKYDKEKKEFTRRNKSTTGPFADLNREALALVIDIIQKKVNEEAVPEDLDNEALRRIMSGANFGKFYSYAMEKVTPAEEGELLTTAGEWRTFKQGTDHMLLVETLQGKGTGWCTAGESTARDQLSKGDFHVYYSYDATGNASIPRIAIRQEGKRIAEIRGISEQQNMDSVIASTNILETKLQEFGGEGEKYQKKDADMKRLTEIEGRLKKGEELSEDDLRFLYQLDGKIEGFGYQEDPRIQEIITQRRDLKKDLAGLFQCTTDEISQTTEEALSGEIRFHYGDLDLDGLTNAEGLTLPKSVGGGLYLGRLTNAEGLTLPKSLGGGLYLRSLRNAGGLTLPKSLGGGLYLGALTNAEGLTLPKSLGGGLHLDGLTNAEGLTLPESVGADLYLNGLTNAEGLTFPKSVGGGLHLGRLTNAEGLTLP